MKLKEFSKWTADEVEEYFQLELVETNPYLKEWMTAEYPLSENEETCLTDLFKNLRYYANSWNEQELKMNFISLLIHLADYHQQNYGVFFEREISVKINGKRLSGTVDCMVAKGRRSPKLPYFCLHEYKRERHSSNDPHGQLLIAMVAAQKLNPKDFPVYSHKKSVRIFRLYLIYDILCFSDIFLKFSLNVFNERR